MAIYQQTQQKRPQTTNERVSTPTVAPPPPKPPQAPVQPVPQPFDNDMAVTTEAFRMLDDRQTQQPRPAQQQANPTVNTVPPPAPAPPPVPPAFAQNGSQPLPAAPGFPIQTTGLPADDDITNEALGMLGGGSFINREGLGVTDSGFAPGGFPSPPFPEGEPPIPVDPNDMVLPPEENDVAADLSAFDEQADALQDRIARSREQGTRNIAEVMASRGVLGGSPEFGALTDLESELALQERAGLADIMRDRLDFGQQQRQLELQEQGMEQDEAYRYAVLENDARFRELALDLQRRGLDLDDAYRNAALEWQKESFAQSLGFDRERWLSADQLERDRLRAQIFEAIGNMDIAEEDLPQWMLDIINGTEEETPGSSGGSNGGGNDQSFTS